MRFTIFTHVEHFNDNENYLAYSPYVKEMNIWLNFPSEIEVVAPEKATLQNSDSGYIHPKLKFSEIPAIHIKNFRGFFKSIVSIPKIVLRISKAMLQADHIHIRCPGNIGLIACIVQIFFPFKTKTAKYAGNWDPNSKQPLSYRLQKWILSNTFLSRNIKVLVYGNWPNQSKNIVPFFTASFSETEILTENKHFTSPFKFIFVGSLSAGKRPFFAIQLIEALMAKSIPVKLEIYGNGELKNELQEYIATKNLDPFVRLMGSLKLEELKQVYKESHFLILASRSEGWPKAVAEAMFFGCIPIATSVSCVPYMLEHGEQGILIEPKLDKAESSVLSYLKNEKKLDDVSKRAITWSRQFTLEKFENEIRELL